MLEVTDQPDYWTQLEFLVIACAKDRYHKLSTPQVYSAQSGEFLARQLHLLADDY